MNIGLGGIRFVGDLDICDRLVMPKAKHRSTELGLGGLNGTVWIVFLATSTSISIEVVVNCRQNSRKPNP